MTPSIAADTEGRRQRLQRHSTQNLAAIRSLSPRPRVVCLPTPRARVVISLPTVDLSALFPSRGQRRSRRRKRCEACTSTSQHKVSIISKPAWLCRVSDSAVAVQRYANGREDYCTQAKDGEAVVFVVFQRVPPCEGAEEPSSQVFLSHSSMVDTAAASSDAVVPLPPSTDPSINASTACVVPSCVAGARWQWLAATRTTTISFAFVAMAPLAIGERRRPTQCGHSAGVRGA